MNALRKRSPMLFRRIAVLSNFKKTDARLRSGSAVLPGQNMSSKGSASIYCVMRVDLRSTFKTCGLI
jgi:hypothetical protein